MLVKDLRELCATMSHDPNYGEISKSMWMQFFTSAGMDARSSGWYLHAEDDESLTVVANTWEYDVPAGFAYIEAILQESTVNGTSVYTDIVEKSYWDIRLNGSNPVITFNNLWVMDEGKKLKIIGQARPTVYTNENETIDRGMETFIRERALYFAFRFLGAGGSELARWRQQMSTQAWQTSEMMLQRHPQEFRMAPSARVVPGRG